MSNKFAFLFGLSTGAAVGAFVSWRINKARYDKILEEEVTSMREVLAKKTAETVTDEAEESEPVEVPEDVAAALRSYDRVSEELQSGEKIVLAKHPYIISPEQYGEMDDYAQETLTFYADGVLAYYPTDEFVEDIDGTIGSDSLSHFGDYEDDSIHVRNEVLKTDFEILRDVQKYSEVMRKVQSTTTED